jgi:hypothetical protein
MIKKKYAANVYTKFFMIIKKNRLFREMVSGVHEMVSGAHEMKLRFRKTAVFYLNFLIP